MLASLIFVAKLASAQGSSLNPLNAETIDELVVIILDAVIKIGVPVVTFMILLTGFQYATAQGNTGKISKAHWSFLYTVIGTAIVVGAKIIHSILVNTLLQLTA